MKHSKLRGQGEHRGGCVNTATYLNRIFNLLGIVVDRDLQKGQTKVQKVTAYLGLQLISQVLARVLEGY